LFFGSWDGFYYCLDANTGKMKWKFDCRVTPFESGFHNMRSSAQYVDGRIYFGTGAVKVHCVDAATGKEIWQTLVEDKPEHDPQLSSSVNVYKGMVFVGTSSGHAQIACLDAETGAVRWRFYVTGTVESGGGSIWTSPAIDEERDVVFNGTGSVKSWMPAGPALFTESMLANDLHTGELLWYYQAGKADTHDLDFSCHPMIFDATHPTSAGVTRKCVGAGKKDGFYCFDRQTGERFWKAMLTNSSSNGGPLLNSTAAAYNRIFVVSNGITPKGGTSVTAALNAYTGDVEWWIPNTATHMAPVAVANKVFYQGFTNGSLEALDADTGRTLWQYKLPSAHRGGIAIANGTLYTSSGEVSLWGKATADRHGLYAFSVDGK
jgi:outer membrane protein assembly factor BamB